MTRLASSFWSRRSRPATVTTPPVGGITPASTRIVVDLPAPLRPSNAMALPGSTLNETPRTASTDPKRTHNASTSTAGETGEETGWDMASSLAK